jgi:repressor LexA
MARLKKHHSNLRSTPLTARQAELLRCIRTFTETRGYPPSIRDMADLCGISSPNGVQCHLRALEKKGAIRRTPGISRGIAILD